MYARRLRAREREPAELYAMTCRAAGGGTTAGADGQ